MLACTAQKMKFFIKGTVMQRKKSLINARLLVPEVSWKFRILIIYNFAAIYP